MTSHRWKIATIVLAVVAAMGWAIRARQRPRRELGAQLVRAHQATRRQALLHQVPEQLAVLDQGTGQHPLPGVDPGARRDSCRACRACRAGAGQYGTASRSISPPPSTGGDDTGVGHATGHDRLSRRRTGGRRLSCASTPRWTNEHHLPRVRSPPAAPSRHASAEQSSLFNCVQLDVANATWQLDGHGGTARTGSHTGLRPGFAPRSAADLDVRRRLGPASYARPEGRPRGPLGGHERAATDPSRS